MSSYVTLDPREFWPILALLTFNSGLGLISLILSTSRPFRILSRGRK